MFCNTDTAARIERAEADTVAAGTSGYPDGLAVPLAGGVASFAGPGSPLNKIAGLGFHGAPTESELDAVEREFAARNTPVQAEVASLADPAICELLSERGYLLVSFEDVLGLPLVNVSGPVIPDGIAVRHSGTDELASWLDVIVDGFATPDEQGVPSHESFPREVLAHAISALATVEGEQRYIAIRDGVVAGAASMRVLDGVAQLNGAATAAPHRRRGIQTALLTTRLHDAAQAGADLAVVTTQPGSRSQQNTQRLGFSLLYTRAILVKGLRN
ncbi:GNAT family N-acetyltransferase [Mycobacterium sp. CBMA271]|uniref:GNAT family N-acetyltransferase n=1 Tax=unclassified Mycobacteroides TaxID=2618759 RepID=UPI0013286E87|nr:MULTISPECIES: GNAT family N-acetyltransferase [unclassified Mycobacteroides]MUM15597.1 GNAT family N-acetyltransferase [Mycobacteroides sp. CBMA 326]MUM17392.1 GNAT family N-acetyltransferase [Mycobacteroides sp. CBMA 326]MUM21867.1 GNAT family N-acetyltransferase [Mycobacteroides sp. CBMA 271]